MNSTFKIDESPIVNVLLNKDILIPVYQRSYKWKPEHVNALIDDLISRSRDESSHYFGVIAISKDTMSKGGKDITISKVIDGQQRLTTSLILYMWLVRNSGSDTDGETQEMRLNAHDIVNFKYEMKDSTLGKNVNNLLLGNYSLLQGAFKENFEVINERLKAYSPDFIKRLLKTFRTKFIVATLDYEIDRDEEMLVFENLNSKGSPLAPFDLIKNYVLSMCEENPQENLKSFQKSIINLTQTVYKDAAKTESKKEAQLERFMEFYTVFKKCDSLDKYANYPVYKNFKTQFRDYRDMKKHEFDEFLYDMRKYAILFFDLETQKNIGKNIWLKTLSNKDNHYFFVFSLFERMGEFDRNKEKWKINTNIEAYLKVIAQHVLKVMTVQGTGQSFTNMYINIMKLFVNDAVTPQQLKEMLKEGKVSGTPETPSDSEFSNSLLEAPKQKWIPTTLVHILEYIACKRNDSNELIDYQEPSIEHILPQKAKEVDWPFIENNADEYKRTLNQIGNLVIFNKSANSKLGNKPFIKKLETYNNSSSPLITGKGLTIEPLTSSMTFTFETIKKRTKAFTKEIIKEFNL